MMNFNRNTRTLIISFVVAVFVLVPLRFYEEGARLDRLNQMEERMVLGVKKEGVVLPDSEMFLESDLYEGLEQPYREIEMLESCVSGEVAEEKIVWLVDILENEELDEKEVNDLVDEIERVEESVCK
ncbi:hypothetical protein KKE45_03130 [Patescibacteria group bacterium]|nr:hypothetical protein [Patescibacteria group bacterium]